MSEEKKITRKKIEATKACRKLMADHFYEMDEAVKTGSKKIAWCTSVGPAELLRGMGFLVYYPENHAAILGSNRTAMDYIPVANAHGCDGNAFFDQGGAKATEFRRGLRSHVCQTVREQDNAVHIFLLQAFHVA